MQRIVILSFALVSWLATDVATLRAQALAPAPAPVPAAAPTGPSALTPGRPGSLLPARPPVAGQPGAATRAPEPPPSARKHFRWVDSAGVVNYADSPPPVEYAQPDGAARPAIAPAVLDDKEIDRQRTALVEELLTLTLAKRSLGELGTQPPKMTQSDPGEAKLVAAMTRAIADAVNPVVTYPILRDGVRGRVDDALLAETLTWYRTPVGRKLARLAVEAQGAQAQAELVTFADKIRRDPPAEERVALADRLDAGMGLTEAKLDMVAVVMKALAQANEASGAQGARARASEDVLSMMRNRMRAPTRSTSLLTILYAYRSVPDAELKSFAEFLETDAGRWYARTSRGAALDVMERVLEKAAAATVAGKR